MIFLNPTPVPVAIGSDGRPARTALPLQPLDWSKDNAYQVNTGHLSGNTTFKPRTLVIDNSMSTTAVQVSVTGAINQSMGIAPGQSGVYPVVASGTVIVTFTSVAGIVPGSATRVILTDYELSYNTWSASSVIAQATTDTVLTAAERQVDGGTILAVQETTLHDALANGGKLPVSDAVLEGTVNNGVVSTHDAALAATIATGLPVSGFSGGHTDYSIGTGKTAPTGNVQATIPANPERAYIEITNQDPANVLVLMLDDGTGNNVTVIYLAVAAATHDSGGSWSCGNFKGRARIYTSANFTAFTE